MAKTFLIQSKTVADSKLQSTLLPVDDADGYILSAIDFYNWWIGNGEKFCDTVFRRNDSFSKAELTKECIPFGTVEFCLTWYRRMGCGLVRPLNIPKPLWPYVRRGICEGAEIPPDGKFYMAKDVNVIKAPWNRRLRSDSGDDTGGKVMQFTEWRNDIESEWRLFVYRGKVHGVQRYIGEPWSRMPDREYCENVAKVFGEQNPAFTLDVFVRKNGETDILEVHDFFACGRYGFDDPIVFLNMLVAAQQHILTTYQKKEK